MTDIPRLPGFDHTWNLAREGYLFLPRRFLRLGTDVFETRLLLRKTICLQGSEATELFYDSSRFQRRGAAPRRLKNTLFGRGGVQGLDGQAHIDRKAMFMSLMEAASIERMIHLFERHWREAIVRWQAQAQVESLVAVREVLMRTVCDWAGVPLSEEQVGRRSAQLAALVDAAGGMGPRYWRGRLARLQADRWMAELIEDVRSERLSPSPGSAAHVVAWHREGGELLPPRVAAVELNNVLRPIVAIDRYITFAALALHEHAQHLQGLAWDWDDRRDLEAFVQEVRRHYPFFPAVSARVRAPFVWRGHHFPKGRRVLLDVYGTNHDPRSWVDPDQFRPERFRGRRVDPNTFIPQGGGDYHHDHRCAGERLTIDVMTAAVRLLKREMSYRVSEQDLRVDHTRIPAQPADGFVIEDVRPSEPNAE